MQNVELDTAISMAGLGKFHLGLIFIAGGCLATITFDSMGTGFALPIIECEMDLSTVDKGLFSGATFLGMILTTNFWGFVSDVYGRRGVLISSLTSGWLLSVSSNLVPEFWLIVLLRILAGAAYCGMASTIYAYLTEFLPPKQRATFLAFVFLFDGVAFCLMPVIAWLILPLTWSLNLGFVVVRTWRLMFLITSLSALATIIAVRRFPESPKYLVSVGKIEEAIDVLGNVFSTNTGNPRDEYPVKGIIKTVEDNRSIQLSADSELSIFNIFKAMKNQISPIFGREYVFVTVIGCFLQFSVYSSAYGSFLWLPDIVNHVTNYEDVHPNISVTICSAMSIKSKAVEKLVTCKREVDVMVYVSSLVFGGMYIVGCALVGFSVKVFGNKTLFAVLQTSGGIACFGIYWATSSISATILATIYTLLPSVSQVLSGAIIVDQYPTHLRGTAICMALCFARLGASFTGNGLGSFFEYDCTVAIFTLGAISLASGLACFLVPSTEKMIKPI